MMKFILFILLFSINAFATLNDVDKQYFWTKNLLLNGGAENGKGSGVHKWTASAGAFSIATSGSNLLTGRVSFTWDAAASADTLSYGQITVPNGLKGKNGLAICKTMVPSGTATHSFQVYDGTNVLGSITIASGTTPTYQYASFIWPSSGYVLPRFYANANEPSITIDDCWLGDASEVNVSPISQAAYVGTAYFPITASCTWTRTSATFGAFGTVAACPGPTIENGYIGSWQTTDTDLPKVTINNLPAGRYQVIVSGVANASGSVAFSQLAVSDGTNTRGASGTLTSNTLNPMDFTVVGNFEYTTAGNRTFELYGAISAAGTINVNNTNGPTNGLRFDVYRYPLATEQAYRPDQVPFYWEGRHQSDCTWTRSNTAYGDPAGDASCSFVEYRNVNAGSVTSAFNGANTLTPGVTFTAPRTSVYQVCMEGRIGGSTAGATQAFQMVCTPGTITVAQKSNNLPSVGASDPGFAEQICGTFQPTAANTSVTCSIQLASSSGSSNIQANTTYHYTSRWTIQDIMAPLPAPLLVNSVVSSYGGVVNDEMAKLNCDGSSAITSQLGSWVSSIGNISGGACTVTLPANAFSATPYCLASVDASFASLGLIVSANATSATSVTIDCEDDASTACTAFDVVLHCRGAK